MTGMEIFVFEKRSYFCQGNLERFYVFGVSPLFHILLIISTCILEGFTLHCLSLFSYKWTHFDDLFMFI